MTPHTTDVAVREAGWVDRLFAREGFNPQYQELKFTLHRKLLDRINLEMLSGVALERVRSEVRGAVARLVEEEKTPLSLMEKDRIIGEVLDEVFGLGPLEPLLADPTISDILVTTPRLVYIERAGKLFKTSVQFKDSQHLMRIIEKIVARVGRRVDESSPLVDARLPDGSRVNAAIPPVAVDGPLLSIRRFGRDPLKASDLVHMLTLTEGMMELLRACVKARLNIVISGGTGAGKTTLLNVLSSFIAEDERIVTIEDAAELRLNQEHVARMETRPPNIEGTGAIRIRELVINALRMRPDRIIIGECRGPEAFDMMQAMNTGHDGSMTTVHSNSARDAFSRLETMVMMASQHVPDYVIRQMLSAAVQIVVHMSRLPDGGRKIMSIAEVCETDGHTTQMHDIFVFEREGISQSGKVMGRFRATGYVPRCLQRLKAYGVHVPQSIFKEEHAVRDR